MSVWKTKDGREIPFDKLDDGHLLNILRFLARAAALRLATRNVELVREQWPEEAHDEQDKLFKESWRDHVSKNYAELEAEARARSLDLGAVDEEGRLLHELVEAELLSKAKVTCEHGAALKLLEGGGSDCQKPGAGLTDLMEQTLCKKDPLNKHDFDFLRLFLARAIAEMKRDRI